MGTEADPSLHDKFFEVVDGEFDGPSDLASQGIEIQTPYGMFTTGLETVVDATRAATMTSTGYTGNNSEESC